MIITAKEITKVTEIKDRGWGRQWWDRLAKRGPLRKEDGGRDLNDKESVHDKESVLQGEGRAMWQRSQGICLGSLRSCQRCLWLGGGWGGGTICYLKMFVQIIWLPGAMLHKFTSQSSHSSIPLTNSF